MQFCPQYSPSVSPELYLLSFELAGELSLLQVSFFVFWWRRLICFFILVKFVIYALFCVFSVKSVPAPCLSSFHWQLTGQIKKFFFFLKIIWIFSIFLYSLILIFPFACLYFAFDRNWSAVWVSGLHGVVANQFLYSVFRFTQFSRLCIKKKIHSSYWGVFGWKQHQFLLQSW